RRDREGGENKDQRPVAGRVRDDLDGIGAQTGMKSLPQQASQRNQGGQEEREFCEAEFHSGLPELVIPSEARDLHFAANCRSLASLGMTNHLEVPELQITNYKLPITIPRSFSSGPCRHKCSPPGRNH